MAQNHCKHGQSVDAVCTECLRTGEQTALSEAIEPPAECCMWCWENGKTSEVVTDDGELCYECSEKREMDRRAFAMDWEQD